MATATKKATVYPIHELSLNAIKVDYSLQSRVETSVEYMREYSEAMLRGDIFPPVKVIRDQNGKYWLYDGFHRFGATKKTGAKSIRAEVRDGTKEDAYVLSAGSNKEFSIKRSKNDIRKAAYMLFALPEWWGKSDNLISQHIGAATATIKAHRVAYSAQHDVDIPSVVDAERNGTSYKMAYGRQPKRGYGQKWVRPVPQPVIEAPGRLQSTIQSHQATKSNNQVIQELNRFFLEHKVVFDRHKVTPHTGMVAWVGYGFIAVESSLWPSETVNSVVGRILMMRQRLGLGLSPFVVTTSPLEDAMTAIAREMGIQFKTPDEFVAIVLASDAYKATRKQGA